MMMRGFGDLQTPRDLLEKLRRDHDQLLEDPENQDLAFNFFVVAYHLIDWLYPGRAKAAADQRKTLESGHILLQVVSHLANGSKHFVAEDKRHHHVTHVDAPIGEFAATDFDGDAFQTAEPVLTLDGQAAAQLGAEVRVTTLASMVLNFWDDYFQQQGL